MSRAHTGPSPAEANGSDTEPGTTDSEPAGSGGTAEPVDAPESVVRHTADNGVWWITLDRPQAMNALTWDQRERLIGLLAEASASPQARAVVLAGTGRAFCAGADLRGGTGGSRAPGEVARTIRRGAQRLTGAVLDCEKPVLAAVNGTAAGLGAHLAFACDLVLAAEEAAFTEVFARRGLVPDGGGAYLLARLAGPQRAKELMFFGDTFSASDAERFGLVNRVLPGGELTAAVRGWAERLAAGPTRSLTLTKRLVNDSLDVDRAAAFEAEAQAQELNMATEDAQEGVAAFTERRRPHFTGS